MPVERWTLVDVEGVRIEATAFEWMNHLESNGEDKAASLELASYLTDVVAFLGVDGRRGFLSIRLTEGT